MKTPAAAMHILNALSAKIRGLSPALLTAVVFFLGIVLYSGTLRHSYVLDDIALFTRHRYIEKGIAGIPEILGTPYWYGYIDTSNGLYRPLSLVLFAVLKSLCGATPFSGHCLSILLYGTACALFVRFLNSLLGREQQVLSLGAALLFVLHPVHTEVAANIKSCDETLSFSFVMLALTAFTAYFRSGRSAALAGGTAFTFLAMLSKESAICLGLLVPLLAWFEAPGSRRTMRSMAGTLLGIGIFLAIRFVVLRQYESGAFHPGPADNALAATHGFSARLANAFMLLGHYLRLLLVPAPLICDYSWTTLPLRGWTDAEVLVPAIIVPAAAALSLRRLLRQHRDPAGFGALFFLAGIALFSNLFFLIGSTFAERFLFLPSAGFCIAAAALFRGSRRSAVPEAGRLTPRTLVLAAILPVFALMSYNRSQDWSEPEALYTADIPKAPLNYRLPYFLATTYVAAIAQTPDPQAQRAYLQQAIDLLRTSVANYGKYGRSQAELGHLFMIYGLPDSGFYYNTRALAINPMDTFTRNNIAGYYFSKGNYRESIRLSRENIRLYPDSRRSYGNIGASFLKLGQPDSALAVLRAAWSIDAGNPRIGYLMSVAFQMLHRPDSASAYAIYAPKQP